MEQKRRSNHPMKLHFHKNNGPADDAIQALIDLAGGIKSPELIREMIIAALKAGQEDDDNADLKLMNTTLKEMRFTSKVFGPYGHVKKVTVFGSARTQKDEPGYRMAVALGSALKDAGYMVITGGGPGIMQAVNEGAGAEYSFGVNIRLPFEQKTNPNLDNARSITYKYFFNRKVAFIKEAHAVVLFPGGFGTLDEAMETMTLVQTGKRNLIPLVLIDPPGCDYWEKWLHFLRTELADNGYISPNDFLLFKRVTSVPAAVEHINRFYRRFHSLRFVNGQLVLRLQSDLDEEKVAGLNKAFDDILEFGGQISRSDALPEEKNEPDILHLPRLVVDFDRRSFGRLRKMVDQINRF